MSALASAPGLTPASASQLYHHLIVMLTMLLMPLLRVSGAQYARPPMSARGRMAAPRVLLPKSVSCRQAAALRGAHSSTMPDSLPFAWAADQTMRQV